MIMNKIIQGDCLEQLKKMKPKSIDVVLTDPPYFLDKLDNQWDTKKVHNAKNLGVVTSLPAGMKFDKQQGLAFYHWYLKVSVQLYRVLKPGGFFFSFSSPRLYHRMVCAMEDAGFNIRDSFIWLYTRSQPKAMSLNHFIRKMDLPEDEKETLINSLDGWKTPQVKSCFEPIAMGQKPVEDTFLNNKINYDISLMNTKVTQGKSKKMFPSNVIQDKEISFYTDKVFLAEKPTKKEKGVNNVHKTVKPLSVCKYLIALTTTSNSIVLDPFMGSGTTILACQQLARKYIGIELNQKYIEIAQERL